jgi:putative salt-induced outer membrane protein YdiY
MSRFALAVVLYAAALAVPRARAQDAPPVPLTLPAAAHVAPPPAAPGPRWRAEVDLGYVSTAGNSKLRTLNVGQQAAFNPGLWRFSETFSAVSGYTNDSETVSTLKGGLRADYAVGMRFRLFALGNYTRDRFAGIGSRFEEAVGLAYGLLKGPANVLDFEAGAGRTQQSSTAGARQQYWVSRLATHYKLHFTARASFEQKAELLTDLQNAKNLLVNTESSLVAPVLANVGLKLDYQVRFANEPPAPAIRKTDTILSSGLQLLF